jgi:hypothetical protein
MRIMVILACLAVAALCPGQPTPIKVINHTQPLAFVRWTDPREHAFFADVPRGWRISGGLTRVSAIDTR